MGTIVRHPLLSSHDGAPATDDAPSLTGAAADIRRAAAVVREAQAIRRRLEKLAATAPDILPSSRHLLNDAVLAVQGLADDLAHHQRSSQRRLQGALRRHP